MLTEQKKYLFPLYVFLNDSAAILFCLISLVMSHLLTLSGQSKAFSFELWVWILCYLLPVLLLLSVFSKKVWYNPFYNGFTTRRTWMVVLGLILGSAIAFLVISFSLSLSDSTEAFYLFLPGTIRYDILFIGTGYSFSAMMLIALRRHLIRTIQKGDIHKELIKAVLMVGTDEYAKQVAHAIDTHPEWGMRITGYLASRQNEVGNRIGNHDIVGTIDTLGNTLLYNIVDIVLIASNRIESSQMDTIIQRCHLEGVDVGFLDDHHKVNGAIKIYEQFNGLSMYIFKFVYQQPKFLFLKRVLDLFVSCLVICLFLPVWVVVPLLIRLETQGPIFYRGERVGKGGRRFPMYKFRSMVVDAEKKRQELMHLNDMDGPVFKMKDDPRITRVGRYLRKTSLDELPQLFNVVKGNMSLVGPRPPIYDEVCQYRPWEKRRLSVTQGITGFWQVSGRNEIKFDEWMKLDLLYIEEWSFTLDLIILLKTPLAVIARKGAQ